MNTQFNKKGVIVLILLFLVTECNILNLPKKRIYLFKYASINMFYENKTERISERGIHEIIIICSYDNYEFPIYIYIANETKYNTLKKSIVKGNIIERARCAYEIIATGDSILVVQNEKDDDGIETNNLDITIRDRNYYDNYFDSPLDLLWGPTTLERVVGIYNYEHRNDTNTGDITKEDKKHYITLLIVILIYFFFYSFVIFGGLFLIVYVYNR